MKNLIHHLRLAVIGIVCGVPCVTLFSTPCWSQGKVEETSFDFTFCVNKHGLWCFTKEDSAENVDSLRKQLSEQTDASIAKDSHQYSGGILLDCTVKSKLPKDKYGQSVWLLKPDHIFLGADQISPSSLKVRSVLKFNSVDLQQGSRYRIFALDLKHVGVKNAISGFYIWKGTVLNLN